MTVFGVHLKPAWLMLLALLAPLASLAFLVLADQGRLPLLSEKALVVAYHAYEPHAARPIYYLNYLPDSATYYSQGKAAKLTGAGGTLPEQGFWLAVHRAGLDAPAWECTLKFQPRTGLFDLYLCKP